MVEPTAAPMPVVCTHLAAGHLVLAGSCRYSSMAGACKCVLNGCFGHPSTSNTAQPAHHWLIVAGTGWMAQGPQRLMLLSQTVLCCLLRCASVHGWHMLETSGERNYSLRNGPHLHADSATAKRTVHRRTTYQMHFAPLWCQLAVLISPVQHVQLMSRT